MVDVARRLCEDNHIHVSEIWSYHLVGDEPRFTLVHRNREAQPVAAPEACLASCRHSPFARDEAGASRGEASEAGEACASRQAGQAEEGREEREETVTKISRLKG